MKDLMIVLYVDDAGIVVPMIELINAFIDRLKAKGFELSYKRRKLQSVSGNQVCGRHFGWIHHHDSN
jgi:hypothetical protein